jgi:hypothetical protein
MRPINNAPACGVDGLQQSVASGGLLQGQGQPEFERFAAARQFRLVDRE